MNASRIQGIGMTSERTRRRLTQRLQEEGITDPKVLALMASTPRHLFVDEAIAHRAYEDTALPIGMGQTISQPYIVARMTEILLRTGSLERVLEIGTGSGYQTAVLAQCVDRVYTVERISALQSKARKRLAELRLLNVEYKYADGTLGWPEKAPYDAILVTAAPETVPQELLAQLAEGGRLILPVGAQDEVQELQLIQKIDGEFETHHLEKVKFVPLLGGTIS